MEVFKQFLILELVVLLKSLSILGGVNISELIPFSVADGSQKFNYEDDRHTRVSLEQNFKFLGTTYSSVHINGNGLITFGAGGGEHNYNCRPNASANPSISVFMTDSKMDDLETAELLYRQDNNQTLLQKVASDVRLAFPTSATAINLNWMLVITWYNIPPYDRIYQFRRNTFQAILTSDGIKSFVLLYYNRITWPTGSETSSYPPQVGIFGGRRNLANTYLIPGSCTYSLLNITEMSNINIPGKFVFQVDTQIVLPEISPEQFNVTQALLIQRNTYATEVPANSSLMPSAGSSRFVYGDDEYISIGIEKNFKFLGTTYSTVAINGNGLITFGQGAGHNTYTCTYNGSYIPAISVFMADSVNRLTGDTSSAKLLYRQDTNPESLQRVSKDVMIAFPDAGNITLDWMLIVTWYNTPPIGGYYYRRNTFQAILTTDGLRSFVLFYYDKLTWPSKEVGKPAVAGIFGGIGNYNKTYLIPGSCKYTITHITEMSNIDIPGKFVFRVDNNAETPSVSKSCKLIEQQKRNPNYLPRIHFTPTIVPAFGLEQTYVHGLTSLCLKHPVRNITCLFSSKNEITVETSGQTILGNLAVLCIKPDLSFQGKVEVTVTVWYSNEEKFSVIGHINVYAITNTTNLIMLKLQNSLTGREVYAHANWNPKNLDFTQLTQFYSLLPKSLNLSVTATNHAISFRKSYSYYSPVTIYLLELNDNKWRVAYSFNYFPNNGSWVKELAWSSLNNNFLNSENEETVFRAITVSRKLLLNNGDTILTEVGSDMVEATLEFDKLGFLNENEENIYSTRCQRWHKNEPEPPIDVLPCPYTLEQAELDWRFHLDKQLYANSRHLNPLNYTVYLQSVPSNSGAGSMCVYNRNENLVLEPPYGSRIHKYSPNNKHHIWNHYRKDLLPYLDCCVQSSNKTEYCQHFFHKRTLLRNLVYESPVPFRVTGATQVTSVNGKTKVFNLVGEYWLLKLSNKIGIQVLLQPYSGSNANGNVSVVTQAAFTISKIRVESNPLMGLLVWLDGEPLNFYYNELTNETGSVDQNFTISQNNVTVKVTGIQEVTLSCDNGISVRFSTTAGSKSLNTVGTISRKHYNEIEGMVAPNTDIVTSSLENSWRVQYKDSLITLPFEHQVNGTEEQSSEYSQTGNYNEICNSSANCVVDYKLTNDLQFALSSVKSNILFKRLSNIASKNISRLECGKPDILQNGKFGSTNYQVGSSFVYSCNSGYYLKATQKNGQKSSNLFTLTIVCAPNELVSTSSVKYTDNSHASWIVMDLELPLDTMEINCEQNSVNSVTPATQWLVTRRNLITTTTTTPSSSVAPQKSKEDLTNYHARTETESNSNKGSGNVLSQISTVTLWVLVIIMIYVIYSQRRAMAQKRDDTAEMQLIDTNSMETVE